jgi:hypothetical protein
VATRPIAGGVLWCLRTPVVQAYAVRQGNGLDLIDTSTVGQDGAILDALASVWIDRRRCSGR